MGRIIKQCRPYSNVANKRNLCLFEKFVILCKKNFCSLNKRNQLVSLFPPQKQIPTQELCYKVTQSFVTCTLGLPLCTTFLYSLTVNNAPLELSFFRLHHFQKSVKILGNMDLAWHLHNCIFYILPSKRYHNKLSYCFHCSGSEDNEWCVARQQRPQLLDVVTSSPGNPIPWISTLAPKTDCFFEH